PNGLTLEKRKLRGELSEGMLCSPDEIGLGAEHDGLLTLETELAPGTPMPRVLGQDDERLVLDISPMRGDLLGHKGIARELAAAYHTRGRLPKIESSPGSVADPPPFVRGTSSATTGGIEVAIEPGSCCHRFTAVVLDGVTIGPSPKWLRERLAA